MKNYEIIAVESMSDDKIKAFIKVYYDSKNCFTGAYFSNLPKYFFDNHLPDDIYELLAAVGVEKSYHLSGVAFVLNYLVNKEETRPFWLIPEDFDENGNIRHEVLDFNPSKSVEFANGKPYSLAQNPAAFRSAMFIIFNFVEDPYSEQYKISKDEFESALQSFDVQESYVDFFDPQKSEYFALPPVGELKPYYLSHDGILQYLIFKAVA